MAEEPACTGLAAPPLLTLLFLARSDINQCPQTSDRKVMIEVVDDSMAAVQHGRSVCPPHVLIAVNTASISVIDDGRQGRRGHRFARARLVELLRVTQEKPLPWLQQHLQKQMKYAVIGGF